MKNETIKDRMLKFLTHKEMGQGAFEKEVKISNGYINNIGKSIGSGIIKKIKDKFPELNSEWLLTGIGEMLNTPEIIENNNGNSFVELGNGMYLMKVPLMEIEAQAGFADNYQDVEYIANVDTYHSIITNEVHRGRYVAFRVQGSSMDNGKSDAILPNDIVTGRELQMVHWKDKLRYNKVPYWVIATTESSYPLLKEIVAHDVEKGIITCHSLNTSPEYQNFEVHLDTVTALFYVIDINRPLMSKAYYY